MNVGMSVYISTHLIHISIHPENKAYFYKNDKLFILWYLSTVHHKNTENNIDIQYKQRGKTESQGEIVGCENYERN